MAAASELGGEMAEGWEKQEALLGFLEHVQLASGKVQWSWLLSTASPVVLWPITRSHLGVVASQAPEALSRCFFLGPGLRLQGKPGAGCFPLASFPYMLLRL